MPKVDVNGATLEYAERGTGQPVVFVHGGLNDLRAWTDQLEAFGSKYRTVAYSCRYYHPNAEAPDGEVLPLDTLVEDLAAFLHALDLAPAHLVGASSGGFVCLLLALREPGLVRTLVLAEPPVLPLLGVSVPPKPPQILRLLVRSPRTAIEVIKFGARGIGPASRAFERGDDERGLEVFCTAVLGREAFAKLTETMRQQIRDNVRAFKAQLRAGFPPFGEGDARRISMPTLLVTGERGAPLLLRVTDRLQRLMPRVERVDVRNASHLMYEDNPEAFNQAVLAFLGKHGG
ncbi:MAG: alpha/beta fold hydrolase [Nitrospinota bacterium]